MLHLTKTDAGRAEIRERSLPLSRAARNLLLLIEPGHDSGHWLSLVRGSGEADLKSLIDSGLVTPVQVRPSRSSSGSSGSAAAQASSAPVAAPAPARAAPPRPPDTAPSSLPASDFDTPRMPLAQALNRVAFRELYDRLTAEAKPRLGLIAGYRAILAIERATDIEALRDVALQFVEQVREAKGDAAAQESAQYLADGRRPRR